MLATYEPAQQVALKDEHKRYQDWMRFHKATCAECAAARRGEGVSCIRQDVVQSEIDSITEALGWDTMAAQRASAGDQVGQDLSSFIFIDRTTAPRANGDYEDRWEELAGFDSTYDPERDESSNGYRPVIRQTHVSRHENLWMATIEKLGDNATTRAAFKAALRIWFPKETNPHASSDVAIYKTFLTVRPDNTSEVYCAPCKRRIVIQATMEHLVSTLRHALSHAPDSVRKGVEFDTKSFRLTESTAATTQDELTESFSESVKKAQAIAQAYTASGQTAAAAFAMEAASWYAKAADFEHYPA